MNNIRVINSQIMADVPTSAGNIYPRKLLLTAIDEFNKQALDSPKTGGILDREAIWTNNDPMMKVKKAFLNDSNVLCFEVDFFKTPKADEILKAIDGGVGVVARPIMSVPSFVIDKPEGETHEITMIYSIRTVHLELEDNNGKA